MPKKNETSKLIVWDVQHGNAALIRTPNGKSIVIDTGTGSHTGRKDFSPLEHLATAFKVKELEYLIISHPHLDHISDIELLSRFKIENKTTLKHLTRKEIIPKNLMARDKNKFDVFLSFQKESKIPTKPILIDGVSITVFSPKPKGRTNVNNHSLVVVVEYLGYKIILPGDLESPGFKDLIENDPGFLKSVSNATVLIAPHHGRKAGFYEPFTKAVSPELTIISDGPKVDSSAREKYTSASSGRSVSKVLKAKNRNPKNETRYALSTNQDGYVLIEIGKQPSGKRFFKVKTKKHA